MSQHNRINDVALESLRLLNPVRGFFKGLSDPLSFVESMAPIVETCRTHYNPITTKDSWPDPDDLILDVEMANEFAENEILKRSVSGGIVSSSTSKEEIACVRLYTMEAGGGGGGGGGGVSFYRLLNRLLRDQDRNCLVPFIQIIWLLMHALSKCPEFEGRTLHR